MESSASVPTLRRNFILQQGFPEPATASCPVQYSALLFQPRLVGLVIAPAFFLLALAMSSLATAAPPTTPLVVWPGYALDLPSGYCVEIRRGPDFAVRYLRSSPKAPVLVGIYAGHAPNFEPDCAKATRRSWTSNGLSLKSVRGSGDCAEFLVSDPKKQERGFLHIWFGPDVKDHLQLAQQLVDSVRPAPSGSDNPEPPPCN